MKKNLVLVAAFSLLFLLGTTTNNAFGLVISASDSGGYLSNGITGETYYVNEYTGHRNWFSFDLSGLTGIVQSAAMLLYQGDSFGGVRYEQYSIAPGHVASLPVTRTSSNPTGQSIWGDLGGGVLYSSTLLDSANNWDFITITLTPSAIIDINNSLGGTFALGGRLQTPSGRMAFTSIEQKYYSQNSLVLEFAPVPTPEPATILLLGAGLVGFVGVRFRKKKK